MFKRSISIAINKTSLKSFIQHLTSIYCLPCVPIALLAFISSIAIITLNGNFVYFPISPLYTENFLGQGLCLVDCCISCSWLRISVRSFIPSFKKSISVYLATSIILCIEDSTMNKIDKNIWLFWCLYSHVCVWKRKWKINKKVKYVVC